MQTKKQPKFKKGPVSAEIKAQIEADFLAGSTEAQLSVRHERSPEVIAKVLQTLAMRPKPVARTMKAAFEFRRQPLLIKTPNGCEFELQVPVGMDATNNTVMLEQIQRFLDSTRAETPEVDRLKESEK